VKIGTTESKSQANNRSGMTQPSSNRDRKNKCSLLMK